MGDRALVQFKTKNEASPVLYTHWGGSRVLDVIRDTHHEVGGKVTECGAALAWFVKNMADETVVLTNQSGLLTEDDSPGDCGCIIVDIVPSVTDVHGDPVWNIYAGGGYGGNDGDAHPLDEVPPLESQDHVFEVLPLEAKIQRLEPMIRRLSDIVSKQQHAADIVQDELRRLAQSLGTDEAHIARDEQRVRPKG